jgi:hypothetical protein
VAAQEKRQRDIEAGTGGGDPVIASEVSVCVRRERERECVCVCVCLITY